MESLPGDVWTRRNRTIFIGHDFIGRSRYFAIRGIREHHVDASRASDLHQTLNRDRPRDLHQMATICIDLHLTLAMCGTSWSAGSPSDGRRKWIKANKNRTAAINYVSRSRFMIVVRSWPDCPAIGDDSSWDSSHDATK